MARAENFLSVQNGIELFKAVLASSSVQERKMSHEKEKQRIQNKQGGHNLPHHATEKPMDDTDRNAIRSLHPVAGSQSRESDHSFE
jgi:hypothetical protein